MHSGGAQRWDISGFHGSFFRLKVKTWLWCLLAEQREETVVRRRERCVAFVGGHESPDQHQHFPKSSFNRPLNVRLVDPSLGITRIDAHRAE